MHLIDEIDIAVTTFVNSFARRWPIFDWLTLDVFQRDSVKLVPVVAAMVWLWFAGDDNGRRRRAVIDGLVGGILATLLTRGIQNFFAHRPRPGLSDEFDFVQPIGGYTNDWSSFPSDTATLSLALVTAIWRGSPALGPAALVWAVVVVCFPRLYGGFHYLSDLVAGAAIGVAGVLLVSRFLPGREALMAAISDLSRRYPPAFYTLAFLVLFQVATYFLDPRQILVGFLVAIGVMQTPA